MLYYKFDVYKALTEKGIVQKKESDFSLTEIIISLVNQLCVNLKIIIPIFP